MTEVKNLVADSGAILLDFDGPVCSVFAGYPAQDVANDMRRFLAAKRLELTPNVGALTDPLAVLRWTSKRYPEVTEELDDFLSAAESAAVLTAAPTNGTYRTIATARRSGRRVAIVSNNAEGAIADYLAAHRLSADVEFVAGRARGNPHLMKPHPDSVIRAVQHFGIRPELCIFVGDTTSDVEASQRAGVHPVGFAKTPDRRVVLAQSGAELVIDSMTMLADALETS